MLVARAAPGVEDFYSVRACDLGLIRADSVLDYNDLPDPAESAEEAAANLEEAVDLLMSVVKELRALEVRD